ncbi:SprT-like domain-containing protein [Daejeonella oryzae]|uniref:SprT-like domain-containing protein n=1 Tax=Daejeonella oryzae TaxID=1122943 RepID=UPI0004126EAB|nr:SprT-like domain-containing protein [Daejeonella oryzae]
MDKIVILEKYLPPECAPIVARWIDYFQCEFKVSRNRNSKYGDYRPPFKDAGHRISVNYNLNQYAFLVTTVHEFAHLHTWNEHKRKAKPHGKEWKQNFKRMMRPFFDKNVFPMDINKAIISYLENPAASSCSDPNLFRALQNYDSKPENVITVESLPVNSLFQMKNGRVFRKEMQVRKRFRCVELKTGAVYLFNPLAEVMLMGA